MKKVLYIMIISITSYFVVILVKDKIQEKKANDSYYTYKHKSRESLKDGYFFKALKDSEKAISKYKKNPNGYFIKIKSLIKLKKFTEAEECIKIVEPLCISNFEISKLEKIKNKFIEEKECFEKYLNTYENAKIIKPFINTISKHNAKIKNNDIFYNDYGIRGVKATKTIHPKEIIVEIPRDLLIISSDARKFICNKYAKEEKKSYKDIEEIINKLYKVRTFLLALYALENQKDEKYKNYLEIILSNNYDSFLINFDEKTLNILKGTSVKKKLEENKDAINHDIEILYNINCIKKRYDKETLTKMYNAVSSRNFGGYKDEMILVMYIDLVNHNFKKDTRWYFDEKKNSFCLESIKTIKKGEEIFDTYGSLKSNSQLLLTYGFTDENNSINSETKIEFNDNIFKCRKDIDKGNKNNDILLLIDEIKKKVVEENHNISEIEKEKYVMKKLKNICDKYLKNFDTTLEEDNKYFKNNKKNMSFNEINCYRVRIEEKEVLTWIYNFANDCINFISIYDNDRDIRNNIYNNKNINKYVKKYLSYVLNA